MWFLEPRKRLALSALLFAAAISAQEIELELERLQFGHLLLQNLQLRCSDLKASGCSRGSLSLELPPCGPLSLAPFTLRWQDGKIRLAGTISAFGGKGELLLVGRRGRIALEGGEIAALLAPWRRSFERLSGRFDLDLHFADRHLLLQLEGRGIGFDRADYTQALSNGLLRATLLSKGGRGEFSLTLAAGEGLYAPIYWNFRETPLTVHGRWQGAARLAAEIEQEGVLTASFRGEGGVNRIEAEAPFPPFFDHYLAPFLEGGIWEGLRASEGKLWGRLLLKRRRPALLMLDLWDGVVDDPRKRLGARDLLLEVRWKRELLDADSPPFPVTLLAWSRGYLLGLPLGKAQLFLKSFDDDLRLAFPVEIPLADGTLFLRDFKLLDLRTAHRRIVFSAEIRDVSLEALTAALGLPPFSGKVSGTVPRVVYQNRVLRLEGQMVIQIFGGRVVVERMALIDPFGLLPQIRADLRFEGLDLEKITQRFDFGAMGGTVSGYVRDLYMAGGRVVAFDAWLETPEDDPKSHYMTQRAIQNLIKLSGVTGAVTRLYFGFFQKFFYDRIGFGCRLRRGICEVKSLEQLPDGRFLLVRGSPFRWPRIDVIGQNRLVDWKALLERLKRAIRSTG